MMCNYMRFGGCRVDASAGWLEKTRTVVAGLPRFVDEFERLLRSNEILMARTQGVGILKPELAINAGVTGPMLRASGVNYDIRKVDHYSIYDRFSFRRLRTIPCPWEGWGLTEDGKSLILSDGSSTLRFLDPDTFHERREITVKDHGKPVDKLNELEYIHGEIYSNIWYTDRIARISPATGEVLGWIDLSGILDPAEHTDPDAVLNGIAYDAGHDRLFVTGKLWPKLFEIKIVPKNAKMVPVQKTQ